MPSAKTAQGRSGTSLSVVLAAALLLMPWRAGAADMTATIRGEVLRPGSYAIEPGDRLSSLVEKAGGFTDAASLHAAALTRKSAAGAQGEELRAIVLRIESEAGPGESPRGREERIRFIEALKSLTAAGRVPVRLSHPRLMNGTADDVPLADGDILTVPAEGATVAVAGAVKSPGAIPARANAGYRDYIRAAGGATADADTKKEWLLAADGTALPLTRPFVAWDPGNSRWEFTVFRGEAAPVRAGDTVVVPKKTARIAWLRAIPDIDALLVRIAILTGKVLLP